MAKDYYGVLGLSKGASEEEIKRAYRRQSLQWHPDKNPDNKTEAEEKFKRIAEAYQVLNDPEKRRIVDAGGDPEDQTGGGGGGGGGGMGGGSFRTYRTRGGGGGGGFMSADALFREFFGGRDPFEMMGGGGLFGDDDFFGGSLFGSGSRRSGAGSSRSRAQTDARRPRSLFDHDDDPFADAFGSHFGSRSLFSSNFGSGMGGGSGQGGGGGGGTSRMTSTTTKFVNGKKVVTKVTKIRHPDGREEVQESTTEEAHNPSLTSGGGPTRVRYVQQ